MTSINKRRKLTRGTAGQSSESNGLRMDLGQVPNSIDEHIIKNLKVSRTVKQDKSKKMIH